ncbi:MAG: conjugal transfer protein TraF [Pseudomonadota bacterium]
MIIRISLICVSFLFAVNSVSMADVPLSRTAAPDQQEPTEGYWFYRDPAPEAEEDIEKPELPTKTQLEKMRPSEIQELLNSQMDYALTVQTTDAVEDYYRILDFSRRRSRAFAALTNVVMLENPELNARSAYPVTNAGRDELTRRRQGERSNRLIRERNEFALIMFSSRTCGHCASQWSVLQHFADKTGWIVNKVDVDDEPQKAARFGVSATPITVMIRKGHRQWFTVAVGTESFPVVADNAYRGLRLMKGEIDERQFFNGEGDDGGFFDPTVSVNE